MGDGGGGARRGSVLSWAGLMSESRNAGSCSTSIGMVCVLCENCV